MREPLPRAARVGTVLAGREPTAADPEANLNLHLPRRNVINALTITT